MKKILLCISFIFLFADGIFGELRAPDLSFVHLSTETGLPSNRIRDIEQDEEGFMWFATDDGLVRYDGINTKVIYPELKHKPDEDIFSMKLLPYRHSLLVGTDHGLFGYDPVYERLEPLPLKTGNGDLKRVEGMVLSIDSDLEENIWLSIDGEGIYKISPDGVIINQYRFSEVSDNISEIFVDDKDQIWATSHQGEGYLYKFDRREDSFNRFPLRIKGEKKDFGGSAIFKDDRGDYWLGTWEDGLIRFNDRTGEGIIIGERAENPAWHIHSITQYSPDFLMIGSDNGLMLLEINTGESFVYMADELNPDSMSGRFVYPIKKDLEGGIWIGTFYRGISYLSKVTTRFENWHHSRFNSSIGGNLISGIKEDPSGFIWIGSVDGGLSRFDPRTGIFKAYPISNLNDNDNINTLCIDNERLWVGTYSKGVGYFNLNTGKWEQIPVEGDPNPSCYAICKDSKGRIWIGNTETFALYSPEEKKFKNISNLKAWINDIEEDSNGNLWISTQGAGVFRYNPVTTVWKKFTSSKNDGNLLHNHINCIKIFDGDKIYIATPKGINIFDKSTDSFKKMEGLPTGIVANAVEKSGDDLWISTNSGLLMLKPDGKYRTYTAHEGLCDNQFMPGASLVSSDGTIYFGSVHGLCGVNPDAVNNLSSAPPVKFTGLNIVNQDVELGDEHLPKSLNSLDKLVLNNNDHSFTISFAALSYSNPSANRYKYILEGFDKDWHDSTKDNSATYSNLPPGSYTLKVLGANSDGIWNDTGISLKIEVKPVWYLTTFMKILYLVVAIGILLIVTRYILWRLERNHYKELERISDNKEKEMFRSKLSFFTILAHEIRTPVSLIIGPLENVMNSGEKFKASVAENLHVIDRNAKRLLSLVNQLLDYKKVEDNPLPLGFRHNKIIPQLESIAERFRPSMQNKGITLKTEFPDPDLEVDVDQESITKLVSNLLNNAMKFTKNEVVLKCEAMPNSDKFIISVSDNGIGISKENQEKIFRPFYQVLDNINEARGGTGLGLSIVKNVVDAHGGEIKLESIPGHGSTFTVILPLKQKNILPSMPDNEYELQKAKEDISPDDDISVSEDPVMLIVDDNPEMVNFISANFERKYEIVTASNGKEALERMKEHRVEIIICDWMMPVMDGDEFLKKMREDENYSHIPFVMLTAKTDNDSKIESMKSGADAYVEKPFSISYLEARIDNLLEMRALLRKKYSSSPLEPITTIAQTETDNELLRKLQALIEENFSNPNLNVDYLADHLGISRSGLYSKIKSLADVTPNELIQITRLKKAAELLSENKYRINEICFMVGFNSSSYFSRCFQRQFGMKPGEFIGKK